MNRRSKSVEAPPDHPPSSDPSPPSSTNPLTGEERIASRLRKAGEEGRAALMPYMMAGFPDRESSFAVAEAYADSGRI